MANITQEQFAFIKRQVGPTALDATADSIAFSDEDVTLTCISGNIWINPNATAVADATAFQLTSGQALDLRVLSTLSIISDVSGAYYEYIVWKRMWD